MHVWVIITVIVNTGGHGVNVAVSVKELDITETPDKRQWQLVPGIDVAGYCRNV